MVYKYKKSFEQWLRIYIIGFGFWCVIYLMAYPSDYFIGEADDYTVMTASFLQDGNFTISQEDIEYHKQLFPEWAHIWENGRHLTGFYTKNGDEMTGYAPFYSFYCVPFVLLTCAMGIKNTYAFRLANLSLLMIALFTADRELRMKRHIRLLFLMSVTIHPVVLILIWPSGETFGYAMLLMSILYWKNKKYYRSAVFCAFAGTYNIVILLWGAVMGVMFLWELYREAPAGDRLRRLFRYAVCYTPAFMIYAFNLYEMGHLNATSGVGGIEGASFLHIWQRFVAYLSDLNFGLLPYFFVIMLTVPWILAAAVRKKQYDFIAMAVAFLGIAAGYSVPYHINCGVAAIARYNLWNSLFLIGICFYGMNDLIQRTRVKKFLTGFTMTGLAATFFVTRLSSAYSYVEMLPVASWVLDHAPAFYQPLHATFNSRVTHVDGGYDYECPLIYYDKNGHARKILVDPQSTDTVEAMMYGSLSDRKWLKEKLDNVTKEQYLSIGSQHQLAKAVPARAGTGVRFEGEQADQAEYVASGLSGWEGSYVWTDGNELVFSVLKPDRETSCMNVLVTRVFNGSQHVRVYVNEQKMMDERLTAPANLKVPLTVNDSGVVSVRFELPDAAVPAELGDSSDMRMLALAISSIRFE